MGVYNAEHKGKGVFKGNPLRDAFAFTILQIQIKEILLWELYQSILESWYLTIG